MNERIRELAEQAFQPINDISTEGVADRYTFEQAWFQMYNQKFAELIVRDVLNICHDIARPQSNGDDHKFTPGAKAVDKLVRKFYGVE